MGEVGDGSMSSPQFEHLHMTENDDGSMGVDLSNLENPDVTVSNSVTSVARYCRRQNKELRVKLPSHYFKFIALLSQMGFDKIQPAESTESCIVLRKDKSVQVASDVTLMQRGTIASSSKPCNLICSQTPDATLAIQTPSETACEQGPEFQHSSRAFPSSPASIGNDNKVVGLQGFSAGPEIPECGVQTKRRPHPANKSDKSSSKRTRGPNFEDEEKGLLVRFKLEYLQDPGNKGQSHAWLLPVTGKMKDHGYNRDPVQWRGLWDTLKRSFDALRRRWSLQGTSYWDLTMDQKKAIRKKNPHFPLTFEPEWYVAMENIAKVEPRSAAKKRNQRDGQEGVFSQSWASTITEPGSANFAGAGSSGANNPASVHHPTQANAQGSDEDQDPQRPGAPPSCNQDLSFLHSPREKDNQEIFVTKEEQLAVWREWMRRSSSDSLGLWDNADCFKIEMADADLAGCNELENQE